MGNIMAAVAYLFSWLSGLIVYFISKDDKVAKFHGMQSILFSVVYGIILGVLYAIGGVLIAVLSVMNLSLIGLVLGGGLMALALLAFVILWLWSMWQAFNDRMYKLPLIGGFAEKWSG